MTRAEGAVLLRLWPGETAPSNYVLVDHECCPCCEADEEAESEAAGQFSPCHGRHAGPCEEGHRTRAIYIRKAQE